MRFPGLIALAAFLSACTPAGMAPAGAPVPATGAAPLSPAAPAVPAASAAPTTPVPPTGEAAAEEVVITGEVVAPPGVQADGVPAAGWHLFAVGEKPLTKAPVKVLDPITNKVLGQTTTDGMGRYRLALGVKVAKGGQMVKISVDVIGPTGKKVKLLTLTRIDKPTGATIRETKADVSTATNFLANRILAKADAAERGFLVQDFLAAVSRLDAALRSEDLDKLDLSDPIALSDALKDIVEGDTTLADLVNKVDGDEAGGDDEDDEDSSSSSSNGSDDDDADADADATDADDDATDVDTDDDATDADTRTPILSGTIQ